MRPAAVALRLASLSEGWPAGGSEAATLCSGERAHAERLVGAAGRRRFVRGRHLLRAVLGDALGIAPAAVALGVDPSGKPRLADGSSSLRFNLSHAHELAAVVIATGPEVGVDVEPLAGPRRRRVLPLALTPGELLRVEDAAPDGPERVTAFLRAWTRKEAYLKGVGVGLSAHLDEVGLGPVPGRDDHRPVDLPPGLGHRRDWTVRDVEGVPGYAVAVAAEAPGLEITTTWWRPPSRAAG